MTGPDSSRDPVGWRSRAREAARGARRQALTVDAWVLPIALAGASLMTHTLWLFLLLTAVFNYGLFGVTALLRRALRRRRS